jgi:hypothetical protein
MARKAKVTPHLRLRVEPSLLARLEKSAEKNGRTLTGEIVDRLDKSFKQDDNLAYVDATAQSVMEKLEKLLAAGGALHEHVEKLFELDLKGLQERFPGEPVDEIVQYLREAAAERLAKLGDHQ